MSAAEVALVPLGVVTVTATEPAACAGETALTEVGAESRLVKRPADLAGLVAVRRTGGLGHDLSSGAGELRRLAGR